MSNVTLTLSKDTLSLKMFHFGGFLKMGFNFLGL